MNIIAIFSGVLVGFTLGLVGGGGSVLATSLLLYAIVGLSPHVAIGTGAFAVSVNAFINFFSQMRSGRIIWKVAIIFAVFGSFGAYAGSSIGKAINGDALIFLFGLAMLGVGAAMARPVEPKLDSSGKIVASPTKSTLVALAVGCLAGFFGIGGGVLIVPGLVLATRMPMLNAISTSLLAVGSFGLTTAVNYAVSGLVDWPIAAQFIGGGLLGGFLGIRSGVFLSRYKGALNKAFAALVFAVASYVLYRSGGAIYASKFPMPQIAAVENATEGVPAKDAGAAIEPQETPVPSKTEERTTAKAPTISASPPTQADSKTEEPPATEKAEEPSSKRHQLKIPSSGVEAEVHTFLADKETPAGRIAWFDLDRVRFATGQAAPVPDAEAQLRFIAEILSAYPNARAIIAGHTDKIGSPENNRRLSDLRAQYVLREFIRMGVEASRLEAKGYGGDLPIASDRTAAGRAKNRRISLGVLHE